MYSNVEFLNNKLYVSTINFNGLLDSIVIENCDNFEFFIDDEKGLFNVIKSDIKVKCIKSNLNEYYKKRIEFLKTNKLYNDILPNYQYISNYFYGNDYIYNDIRIHHLDIEVFSNGGFPNPIKAKNEISLIQIYESDTNIIYLFGTKEFKDIELLQDKNKVIYYHYDNEIDMIKNFIKFEKERKPILVDAWFGNIFDFPYLINRCIKLNIDYLDLSPYRKFKSKKVSIFGKLTKILIPYGVYWFDAKELYENYTSGNRESYSLETIAQLELEIGKVKYKNISNNLDDLYKKNYKLFLEYGKQDVVLLDELNKKLNYINIMIKEAWDMGVNFDDVFSTVKSWTYKLYNELKKENIVLPIKTTKQKETYQGPFILQPKPGKYEMIIGLDIVSEYSNAIRANNISYETIVEPEDLANMKDGNELINLQNKIINNGYENYLLSLNSNELKIIIKLLKDNSIILSGSGEYFYYNIDGLIPKVITKIFNERQIAQNKELEYSKILEMCKTIKQERGI